MLNLRKADVQAKAAVIASAIALVFMLGLIPMVFRNFQSDSLMIYYNPKTMRLPLILACGGMAMIFAVCGFGLGFNSAGHRRNDRQAFSWAGFFLGAAAMVGTMIMLAIFWFWKESVIVG